MALIVDFSITAIPKKKISTYNSSWHEKNKERLSAKRKKRYAEDFEYRQRVIEASRRHRRGERTLTTPPDDALISFPQAAERIGISASTLYEWRRKKFFPEPKHYDGALWFTDKQVLLLTKLKEVIRLYGKRRGSVKLERLKEVVALICANWE
jgi:hypothetical protein